MGNKILYWIFTILLCGLMLFSASMYLLKYEMIKSAFTYYGYPTYIIYPLAIAKILGIIAIISGKSKMLKEWAYAGFFFDFVLALAAHYTTDGGVLMLGIGIVLLFGSYFMNKKVNKIA